MRKGDNLDRQGKEQIVQLLIEKASQAQLLILVDYCGLNVTQMNKLRSELRKSAECDFVIAKNTLARLAFADTDFIKLDEQLLGTNAFLFAYEDPVSPAKALVDSLKTMPKLEIKVGVFNGEVIDKGQIEQLAKMPSKTELQGMLAGVLNAPIRNCAGALAAIPRGLATALSALRDQREKEAA